MKTFLRVGVILLIVVGAGAGVYSVAVTWGGIHARERLEPEEPDALVDTPEELLAALG